MDEKQRGLSPVKYPGQLPQWGQGPQRQLPRANRASGKTVASSLGLAVVSRDHGGDFRLLCRVHAHPGNPLGSSHWGQVSGGKVEISPWLIHTWIWLHEPSPGFLVLKDISLCRMYLITL